MAKGNLAALALGLALLAAPAAAGSPTVGANYTFAPTTVGNRYFRAYAVRISSGQAELWALALEHLEGFTRA